MERENWLEINDYVYRSINLDSDQKIIISVILSFTNGNKKFYMSQKSFSETYGIPQATVSRKFKSLKQDGIIQETENGLCINMSALELNLNIVDKVKKTRKAGPGRKKKQNQGDLNNNQGDSAQNNQGDLNKNQGDSTNEITVKSDHNHGDILNNHGDIEKNQSDSLLLKTSKELEKNTKKEIKKEINQETFDDILLDDKEIIKEQTLDDILLDDIDIGDITTRYHYKPKPEIPKQDITQRELESWLDSLDI